MAAEERAMPAAEEGTVPAATATRSEGSAMAVEDWGRADVEGVVAEGGPVAEAMVAVVDHSSSTHISS